MRHNCMWRSEIQLRSRQNHCRQSRSARVDASSETDSAVGRAASVEWFVRGDTLESSVPTGLGLGGAFQQLERLAVEIGEPELHALALCENDV